MSISKELKKFGTILYQRRLKNGVNLIFFERKGAPVYIRASFVAGSRFDNKSGTAHFLEHMFLAGTERFPSKNLVADYIQKVGGDFEASTDNNILRFGVEIPESTDIHTGIEVMSECLTRPLLDERTIENERGAILSELHGKKNNPKQYIGEVQRRLYLQGTLAARSTLGNELSIAEIKKPDLLEHRDAFINAGRVTFIASGDISIETLVEELERISFFPGERYLADKKLPIIKEKMIDVEFYNLDHLEVVFICRTDIQDYKEFCALRVLNGILAGGRGSRLMTRLRYEKGLVYSVSGFVSQTAEWGGFGINLSCHNSKFEEVKKIIFDEFESLRERNLSTEELFVFKSKVAKSAIRHFQTSKEWVNFHERDAIFSPDDLHTPEDYIRTINEITLDDIKGVIDKYLVRDNFYTAICGNYK